MLEERLVVAAVAAACLFGFTAASRVTTAVHETCEVRVAFMRLVFIKAQSAG